MKLSEIKAWDILTLEDGTQEKVVNKMPLRKTTPLPIHISALKRYWSEDLTPKEFLENDVIVKVTRNGETIFELSERIEP